MKLKFYFSLFVLAIVAYGVRAQSPLQWNEKTHDFKTLEQGAPAKTVFKFTNASDKPIALSKVKASCGCTTPKWTREAVAPGESGEITVSYNSGRAGAFNKSVRVWYDTIPTPEVIYIKGNVKAKTSDFGQANGNLITNGGSVPPVKVEPKKDPVREARMLEYKVERGALRFSKVQENLGEFLSDETKTFTFKFWNASDKPVKFTGEMDKDPMMNISYDKEVIAPNAEGAVTFTVDGSKYVGEDGYFSKRIRVFTDEPGDKSPKQFNITGNFKKVYSAAEIANSPKINFEETFINGGKIIEGEKFVYNFDFQNAGKSPLKIFSAKASCGCTATAPKDSEIAAGEESYITATFDSRGRLGQQSKTITVRSNDVNNSAVTLKFTVEVVKDPFSANSVGPVNK